MKQNKLYKQTNNDIFIKKDFKEKGLIRKTVLPMFEDLLKKININQNIKVDTSSLEKKTEENNSLLSKIIDKLTNQKPPIVNVSQNKIELPETQKIEGEVSVNNFNGLKKLLIALNSKVEVLNKQIIGLKPLDQVAMNNLPTVKFLNKQNKKEIAIPVQIQNWEHIINMSGGGVKSGNLDDKVYIREEYTYTTVNGEKVPTMIEKWTIDTKLTEVYEYDTDGNPTVKSRSLEPSETVGV